MNDIELYETLLNKTKDLEISKQKQYTDLASLTRLLTLTQMTENNLQDISYSTFKADFEELFCGFRPKVVVKNGTYLTQLNRVLDHFEPQRATPFKKFTAAALDSAKFFSKFEGFNEFRTDLYLKCTDEDTTIQYLETFRKECNIPEMYFIKSCLFFSKSGLLDCPVPTQKAKAFLLPLTGLADDNELVYRKMKEIAKRNKITLHELNERLEAVSLDD